MQKLIRAKSDQAGLICCQQYPPLKNGIRVQIPFKNALFWCIQCPSETMCARGPVLSDTVHFCLYTVVGKGAHLYSTKTDLKTCKHIGFVNFICRKYHVPCHAWMHACGPSVCAHVHVCVLCMCMSEFVVYVFC